MLTKMIGINAVVYGLDKPWVISSQEFCILNKSTRMDTNMAL